MASVNSGFTPVSSSFPLSAISLMVSSSPFYVDAVNSMVAATNMAYRDFLKSEEGQGFRGEVNTKIILRLKNNLYAQCNLQFLDTLKRGEIRANKKYLYSQLENIWSE